MEKRICKLGFRLILFAIVLWTANSLLVSCKDDYYYDEVPPSYLGASIYDYVKTDVNYSYYARIIEDLNMVEVLKKTGSKTLFVCNDAAFERFFQNNPWGVSSYGQLSVSQKKLILNFSMIDNAYLIETLSNYNDGSSIQYGTAMRRSTAISVLDSVAFDSGDRLPNGTYWSKYKTKGMHLLKDDTSWPMVHLLQSQLDNAAITDEDFQIITGVTRTANDAHIFGIKIIARDIVCENGYIQVLENVLIPPTNMAEYVQQNENTTIFSGLLDRFCSPYYDGTQTVNYRMLHPEFGDSIFTKRFYSKLSGTYGAINRYPNGLAVKADLLLSFDPGWNSYQRISTGATVSLQYDMAAMFAPTDAAMDYYFNVGVGKLLKERYGSWENVPDDIIVLFLKRHMRVSFIESVPSRFDKMNDEENSELPVEKSDVVGSYLGVNGVVYLTNDVYPPDDYVSVYGPVLFSERTKIFKWAAINNKFRLYLNSLVSEYSFFVPTDEYLTKYIDPFTYGKNMPGALKFWYNNVSGAVNATVFKYDPVTNVVGDSVSVITDNGFILNRLLDLLDNHIVVGNVESGQKYYLTKGGNIVRANGSGLNLVVEGGGDVNKGTNSLVVDVFDAANGKTYFIDKPIQTPLQSTYKVLSETPDFSEFFNLLIGFPPATQAKPTPEIFVKKTNYYGIDYNIKFFNTYNYTVYVPTNAAIQNAIATGVIIPWVSQNGITGINDMTNATDITNATKKLESFLRYHFQDNSVFLSGLPVNDVYQSATIKNNDVTTHFNTYKNKYYKIGLVGAGNDLVLTTEMNGTANVLTQNNLYNIITRDYTFNADPMTYKEIDGSGIATGPAYTSSSVYTSSTAVIHQIDNVLTFE